METNTLYDMKTLNLKRLQNAEHLAFMRDVVTLLEAVEDTHFDELKNKLTQSVEQEDLAQNEITKSEHTASIAEIDEKRDRLYRGLVHRVKAEAFSPLEEVQKLAEKVLIVVRTYGNFTKHNYQKETTEIQNFIADLKSEEYAEAVQKIGLKQWIVWLEEANTSFVTAYTSRRDEYAARPEYNLKTIRKENDEIFRKIKEIAMALAVVQPSEQLSVFISKVNASINKWREVLAQRTKKVEK